MKYLLISILLFVATSLAFSEEKATEKSDALWQPNFKKSMEVSEKENKPIFLLFTGKDWCPPCIALESTILSQKKFIDYAKENMVLLALDFPQDDTRKPENDAIAKQYGVEGFPTILLVNHKGEPFQKFGFFNQTEKEFLDDTKKSINQNKALDQFLKEKDIAKKSLLADAFMQKDLKGTNVIYYRKILFTGLKNSKTISLKDKIIQLADIYIYATEEKFINEITTFLKENDPKQEFGSKKLMDLKEFIKINQAHDDEKAYDFINKNKESFREENASYIYSFALHIAHHGKFTKALNILEFIKTDPILERYPDVVKNLQKTIEGLKTQRDAAKAFQKKELPTKPKETDTKEDKKPVPEKAKE